MEYGEKCTKFFLNLQYRNTLKNNLQKLVTEDRVIYDSPNDILREEANYFQSHPLPLNDDYGKEFFPNNIKLTNVQKDQCEGQITEEELFEAIKSFQSGKTPGLDGIPVEVYQIYLEILKAPLLDCFNYS
uniref:Putative RNA-dependent DNA polymerase n=1 Tax=Erythrocytic necrosis virus TaxID=1543320 RepID=A0A4D6QID8_9VIRU|nr:putative RNA-dependent DNA polymerase [Erythrocytic necrosis virus]